ncbi:MAG: hypothetical protein ACOX27_01700 [Caldicoprobacterales bacterium]
MGHFAGLIPFYGLVDLEEPANGPFLGTFQPVPWWSYTNIGIDSFLHRFLELLKNGKFGLWHGKLLFSPFFSEADKYWPLYEKS